MDMINQSEVNATFNMMFNITCSVESYPSAMVHWEANVVQVIDNNVVLVDTSVYEALRVDTHVQEAIITYTCVAVNVINGVNHFANNSIDVIIQGKMLCDDCTYIMHNIVYVLTHIPTHTYI